MFLVLEVVNIGLSMCDLILNLKGKGLNINLLWLNIFYLVFL